MARTVCIPSIKNVMNWNKVKKFNAHRSNSFLVNSFAFVGPGPARSGRPLRKWRWGSYRQLNRRNNHPKKWRENKEEWPDELVEWLLAAIGCCFFCMWPCVFFFFFFGLLQLAINMHFRVTNAWQRLTGRNFLGSSLPTLSPPFFFFFFFLLFFFPFFSLRIPRAMQV